jgi:hypothetical protein
MTNFVPCVFRFFVVAIALFVADFGHASASDFKAESSESCASSQEECVNPDAAVRTEPYIDPKCPSREHVTLCAGRYLDKNRNGKLERSELQAAIDSLPWYGRGILNILGSVDKMMQKCDVDKDDAISMGYDMVHNAETCLATCFKRMAFKKAFFPDCQL